MIEDIIIQKLFFTYAASIVIYVLSVYFAFKYNNLIYAIVASFVGLLIWDLDMWLSFIMIMSGIYLFVRAALLGVENS